MVSFSSSSDLLSFITIVPLTLLKILCRLLLAKINPRIMSTGKRKDLPNTSIAILVILALSQIN